MSNDPNRNQSSVTFRAQVAGKIGKHAMNEFVRIRRLNFGVIYRLPEMGAGLVEFCARGAVIQSVHANAMRAVGMRMRE